MNRLLRHIASIVLLATYLPMVVMSSLHMHHGTIDAHDDCLQCVGHFETAHHHDTDCLYCTFLSLNCLVQDGAQPAVMLPVAESATMLIPASVPHSGHGVAQLRAPPAA